MPTLIKLENTKKIGKQLPVRSDSKKSVHVTSPGSNKLRSIRSRKKVTVQTENTEFQLISPAYSVAEMRQGIASNIVPEIARVLNITQDKLFECLNLPKSTIKSRIAKSNPLSSVEQDRFYRVNKILSTATRILGDGESAKKWVLRNNRSLGGESPMSLLDTEAGYELVMDTLSRIEFGVIS